MLNIILFIGLLLFVVLIFSTAFSMLSKHTPGLNRLIDGITTKDGAKLYLYSVVSITALILVSANFLLNSSYDTSANNVTAADTKTTVDTLCDLIDLNCSKVKMEQASALHILLLLLVPKYLFKVGELFAERILIKQQFFPNLRD